MKKNYTFSEHFNVQNEGYEYLNIPLDKDLEAFICPFLVVNEKQTIIARKVYKRSLDFLKILNRNYIMKNDRLNGLHFLSNLKEPNEYHLGYSDSNKGKGIANVKAEVIFDSLSNNRFAKKGVSVTNEAQNVLLLVKGIGQDNMSDILANICRDIFAEFTEQLCVKYGIPTKKVKIKYYDNINNIWDFKIVSLPCYMGKHKILLPKNIISGSRDYCNRYNWFISKNYISHEILKGNLNLPNRDKYIKEINNGGKKPIVKHIYRDYRKAKSNLIDFVLKYNSSLLEFQDYAKGHLPAFNIEKFNNAA